MRRVLKFVRKTSGRSVRFSGWRGATIALLSVLILAGCGGDGSGVDEDRRFATDPGDPTAQLDGSATVPPTAIPTIEPTATTAAFRTPEASPVDIVSDVATVYALNDGALVAVDVRTGLTRVIARSRDDERIVGIAASPDGGAVALVWRIEDGDDFRFDLEIRDRQGEQLRRWTDVASTLGDAPEQGGGLVSIDWSDRGGKIAVAFPDGGALMVPVTGDPVVLLTRGQAPAPLSIEWSPAGDAVAYTSRNADSESAYLAIASVQALPVDPVRIAGTGDQRPIYDLSWLPGGSTLLAVQGSAAIPDQVGGDLIQVDRRTLSARFSIGGSRFGPSAEIVTLEASPDGRYWAIVTVSPDARGGLTAAVWLVTPDLSSIMRIGLPDDPPVAGVTWTIDGLSITLFEPDQVRLVTVDRAGNVVPVEAPPASPVASPGIAASPVASPITPPIVEPVPPRATPAATPDGSPEADAGD